MIDKTIALFGVLSIGWMRTREVVAAWPGTTLVLAGAAVFVAGWWL